MKNVAGYDGSRLMTGALGTLGVLLDVSLKVLPRPECEVTLRQESAAAPAIEALNRWAGQAVPLSASCWHAGVLYLRLSGATVAVRAAAQRIGGEVVEEADAWWRALRDQQLAYFQQQGRLWRLSVPPATPPLPLAGEMLIEWGGAQRWLWSNDTAASLRATVADVGGHAMLFRGATAADEIFHPLTPAVAALHRRIKQAFDPAGILNPGRMYAGL